MEIIGVLRGMRKGKQMGGALFSWKCVLSLAVLCLAASLASPVSIAVAAEDATLSTRNDERAITRDPVTGSRVMQTPEAPTPQPGYQGPQTIIVAPEVYPNNRPNRGPGADGQYRPQPDRPDDHRPSLHRPYPSRPDGHRPSPQRPRPGKPNQR